MATAQLEQYIEVGIGQQIYALRIYDIHEIIKMQEITFVPNSAAYLKGIINLRGKIVPIISLRHRFGFAEIPYTKATRIIVVNQREEMVGIVVDQVYKVTTFENIQPAPERVGVLQGSFFKEIGHTEAGLVSVLNLERILAE